jgi:hypothetical protein
MGSTNTNKRKSNEQHRTCTKKCKQVDAKLVSDEDFRILQTDQFIMPQPIGTTCAQIPLTIIERWRMRKWDWQNILAATPREVLCEVESPMGTRFW